MGKKKLATPDQEKTKKAAKTPGLSGGQRVKDMSSTAVIVEEPSTTEISEGKPSRKPQKPPKVRGKKYQEAKKLIEKGKAYTIAEAIKLAKKSSYSKFGGTLEVHFNVIKKGLIGEVQLPYLKGKEKKVAIANEETIAKIKDGKIDFDLLLASPADMAKIVPFAKILGPKGLMPNPKNGTLVPDPEKARANFDKPTFEYKTEPDFPLIHTIIGKLAQTDEELIANFNALIKAIGILNIQKAVLKASMGPGIKVDLS